MRGTILGVVEGRGVLLSGDERRFEFPLSEWRSAGSPSVGQAVDFVEADGEARQVFAVPGAGGAGVFTAPRSGAFILGAIGVGCLVLGFIVPFLPTIAAFVLGVIGAGQAREENNDGALLLSRIAWIGALVLLAVGILALLVVAAVIGTVGLAAMLEWARF